MNSILNFIKESFTSHTLVFKLAKNDFKSKYLTSILGGLWGFIQPLITILVFWFVFEKGFKNPPIDGVPFIPWFIPGFLVWNYFSDTLNSTTNCLREYMYLVKKINFKVSLIPIVKIISSSFIHFVFIFVIILIILLYGINISIYNIQFFYYFFCTFIYLVGLSWTLSSISVFLGDIPNLVNVVTQIGFWMTPVFWDPTTMDPSILSVLKIINPMYYVVQGYRETVTSSTWFWETNPGYTLYFWFITICIFMIGALVFSKLQNHLADVL